MRLILHAGTHKTGTTSIQKVFTDNRDWLRKRGLIYPKGGSVFGGTLPHHKFSHALTNSVAGDAERAKRFIDGVRAKARPGDTVLISAEPIYRHVYGHDLWHGLAGEEYWLGRQRYLAAVADCLAGFDTRILLFFREPKSFARSLYVEVQKKGVWQGTFDDFLAAYAVWFDYDRQISAFRSSFSDVETFSYEEACRDGLLKTFFAIIGFPLPPGAEDVWERRSLDSLSSPTVL
jgi:hypothetical protein